MPSSTDFSQRGTFAVLDERSVFDKTVVFHEIDSMSIEQLDSGIWDPDEKFTTCRSWRVQFSDAYDMVILLEYVAAIWDTVLVRAEDRYTGQDGIFDLQRAMIEKGCKEDEHLEHRKRKGRL
jgi:hypothetical protein